MSYDSLIPPREKKIVFDRELWEDHGHAIVMTDCQEEEETWLGGILGGE